MVKRRFYPRRAVLWALGLLAGVAVGSVTFAQGTGKAAAVNTLFAPLEQWKSAIVAGDRAALRALYSGDPEAMFAIPSGKITADADVAFWTGLKVRRLKLEISESDESLPGLEKITFEAEISSSLPADKQTRYVAEQQVWQQQGQRWVLVVAIRSDTGRLQQPTSLDKQIYEAGVNARAQIKRGLGRAAGDQKRVLIVFGANWCYDCHVLDLAFHRSDIAAVLARDYEVVHVDIGQRDQNQDLMEQYGVPMARGIPAIAVLDAKGKLLFSQKDGEFANARALAPDGLLAFLNKWKRRAQ